MLKGTAYWAKILGKPGKAYTPGEFEWSMDVSIDKDTKKVIEREGWGHRIKNKDDDRGDFVQFKRKSINSRGEPAQNIRVVDHQGNPWPHDKLIGNGSLVNVKYILNEPTTGPDKKPRPNIIAVQVFKHVEYKTRDEFPTYEQEGEGW